MQTQQITVSSILSNLTFYDLDLYLEMGNLHYFSGDNLEAQKWYSKGLSMSRELKHHEMIETFKVLLLQSIK